MNMVILKNYSESDITDFGIAEPELVNGEVRFDDNKNIKSTGKTLLWSIKTGEEKAFPDYVANILLKTYKQTDPQATTKFLDVVEGKVAEEIKEGVPEVSGSLVCRHCGQGFKNTKGLALHISFKHPEKL